MPHTTGRRGRGPSTSGHSLVCARRLRTTAAIEKIASRNLTSEQASERASEAPELYSNVIACCRWIAPWERRRRHAFGTTRVHYTERSTPTATLRAPRWAAACPFYTLFFIVFLCILTCLVTFFLHHYDCWRYCFLQSAALLDIVLRSIYGVFWRLDTTLNMFYIHFFPNLKIPAITSSTNAQPGNAFKC